jgi:hypothetical protein
MAFDNNDRILIADFDGVVRAFDAAEGRFIRIITDVTAGAEQVSAMVVSPVTNELLVVDGRAGEQVRRYDASAGTILGFFGTVGTVATQAVDLVFFGDPATAVFVADAAGRLVRCSPAGDACTVVAASSGVLQPGGPTSIALNPASGVEGVEADVVIADAVANAVIACNSAATACSVFGDTQGLDSAYRDVAFAPFELPEPEPPPEITTTTTSTTLPAP